jgi:predicted RNA-binding Zn ribbon-like protein
MAYEWKLLGGRLCLDFVNTVSNRLSPAKRVEHLMTVDDLISWARAAGLMTRSPRERDDDAAAVLGRAVRLREAIYEICIAVIAGDRPDVAVLNDELRAARQAQRLVYADGAFTWQSERPSARGLLDPIVWQVALSAAELLTAGDLTRLRQCGDEKCGWLFEDTSRNRGRLWCDMRDCGNLAKVRRYRQRHQD